MADFRKSSLAAKVFLGFVVMSLSGCFQSEQSCADEIQQGLDGLEISVNMSDTRTSLQRSDALLNVHRLRSQVTTLLHDEYRDVCDYYLQGSRLALK